ncbi:MAG TPA: PDZ domain-containing protein [Fimbriimonadaceae bacterium]|nr:PDZ domain-containing protein [Fimbriimonadaceae bacterium]
MASPFALLGAWSVSQLTAQEQEAWKAVEPSVAMLMEDGKLVGTAALIDLRGYFLAHKTSVRSGNITARVGSGAAFPLRQRSFDDTTQLVLLIAPEWAPQGRPATPAGEVEKGERLFVVLTNGPVRAELGEQSLGIMNPSRRMMPLNEVKFESSDPAVGGALVFTQGGRFVGVLGATLAEPAMETAKIPLGGGRAVSDSGLSLAPKTVQFGPQSLMVGYAIAPDMLQRVIDGFKSPNHEVAHPVIGVMCRDASGAGAVIERVVDGSPAQLAGLREGDVIVEMGGFEIRNQIDFAKVMLRQKVGSTLAVKVKRGQSYLISPVVVGKRAARID